LTFDYPGYELRFIQRKQCKDGSAHKFTVIYKFYSPITKYWYILNADYHEEDIFAIKFYCKKDSKSEFKYSKIINRGDHGNILVTCAKVIPLLLQEYPTASFAFSASRSVDKSNKTVEPYSLNQRFKTYKYIAANKFGPATFTHFEYPIISCYLMLNNVWPDVKIKEEAIVKMFAETYNSLPDM
jgi:hypothetical protein